MPFARIAGFTDHVPSPDVAAIRVCPATVTAPDLPDVPVLAENVAVMDVALDPEVAERLIQVESLTDADQDPPLQPLGEAAIEKVAVPPDAGILLPEVESDDELTEKVQVGTAAA